MSFGQGSPAHLGLVFPEDPRTGKLGRMWAADACRGISTSTPRQVVRHAVENAPGGPTDVVLQEPEELTVTFVLSNCYDPRHLRPDFVPPDRALRMKQAFQDMADRGQPVAVFVRGYPLLHLRAIANVQATVADDEEAILLNVTFGQLDLVTLQAVPVAQDADLVALGSQIVAGGTM